MEDDPWIRNSLSIFLKQRGCLLAVCETAEEGMERLRKEAFRIILCDYRLPGLDGLVLLRFAREMQPEARRVLVTAFPAGDMIDEAERIGIDVGDVERRAHVVVAEGREVHRCARASGARAGEAHSSIRARALRRARVRHTRLTR